MSTFGNRIRQRVPANGKIAKIISIVYFVWLFVMLTTIVNAFGASTNHSTLTKTGWVILGLSIFGSIIPGFISALHEGIYGVLFYGGGKNRRRPYLDKLDEYQLQIRRQIFEKSYAILATLTLFAVFLGSSAFEHGLSQNGSFLLGYNILILVISLPSIVASWDKSVINHITD